MYKYKKYIYFFFVISISIIIICKIRYKNEITYKIKYNNEKFEVFQKKYKKKYYIEITYNNKMYPLDIYINFNKRKIIKNIYYYKTKNYECIFPLFVENEYIDIMCYNDGIIYNYNEIRGKDSKLDKYVKTIRIYNSKRYIDNEKYISKKDGIKFYNTVKKNLYITTYLGLANSNKTIKLFDNDVYSQPLKAFVDNYYIVADYDKSNKFDFDEFYIVNLDNYEIKKIKYKDKISYDSYIQGIVDNNIYLYDRDNEKQYVIDVKEKNINLISDNKIKYYNNGKWETISINKANNVKYFNYESLENKFDYDYIYDAFDKYYLLKKNNNRYSLFLVYKNSINTIKYLTDIESNNILFNEDYIYYVFKNNMYYYSESEGKKLVLNYSELEFNNDIKYYIY